MSEYLSQALLQIPRLLSRMDREAPSKTYGSFDRTYWGWKFTDFSGPRFQEGLYALSWLYKADFKDNPYRKNKRLKEWIAAGFRYWQSLQHNDGSFDEAYPFERSLAATAFTGFYLGEAYLKIKDDLEPGQRDSIEKTFIKAGIWLCRNDEHHGVLSNHLAVAAAALDVFSSITGNKNFADRRDYFIARILAHQSEEGWYEEYGGADFGYQTHGTFYLACIWRSTRSAELLESLKLSVKLISHFIHPNRTLGGEYGSRNTSFYFPAGFEILASVCQEAAAIAKFMRQSISQQNAAGLAMMDAYNFCPMLNNYFFAHDHADEINGDLTLPFEKEGRYEFPQAGLLVHVTKSYQAIFAPSKGGVLKIYSKNPAGSVFSDCGYWILTDDGSRISSQSFSRLNETSYSTDGGTVSTKFVIINQKVMSPLLFMVFRCFTMTLGRNKRVALYVKNTLVKVLISKRKTVNILLERKVDFAENSVTIEDRVEKGGKEKFGKLRLDAKFSTIHMGSSRYYQPDELSLPVLTEGEQGYRKYIWTVS